MSENIDHIFYINLEHRKDRREEIEQELTNYNLRFERFNAVYAKPGLVGCGLSHARVLRLAKERGYKNVLILEDDFTFLISKEQFEEEMRKFFDSKIPFDVCMLAYNNQGKEDVPDLPFLEKVLNAHTTCGYLVNQHFYDTLIDTFEKAMQDYENSPMHWLYSIDMAWKPLQPKSQWYQFKTRIGKQRPSYSDVGERFVNYTDC